MIVLQLLFSVGLIHTIIFKDQRLQGYCQFDSCNEVKDQWLWGYCDTGIFGRVNCRDEVLISILMDKTGVEITSILSTRLLDLYRFAHLLCSVRFQ